MTNYILCHVRKVTYKNEAPDLFEASEEEIKESYVAEKANMMKGEEKSQLPA
jgi:hypothetical protein